jgi:hypothetical protein
MKEFYIEHVRHILIAIGTPLLIGFFRILVPLKSNYRVLKVDPIEGKKLENKRTFGCFFNFILIAVLLSFAAPYIWQPLYSWLNQYPSALLIERLDNIMIYMLCAYLAAPISVISTNYWFIQQFGEDKFNLLQNHYTAMYKFNNPKAEKLLFYTFLIPAIFVVWVVYSPATFITENEFCYRHELSYIIEKQKISDIEKIDYISKVLYKDGECSGWPNYRVIFKDGTKFYSRDVNDYTPESNVITHQMYQYLSQKSGKPIMEIDCILFSEY